MNALDSLIDVTIGYLDFSPLEISSIQSFWSGTYPREVHMNLNFHRWAEIPTEFDAMKDWLIERFASKERMLEKFYSPIQLMYQPNVGTPTGGIRRIDSTSSSGADSYSSSSDVEDDNTDQFSTTSTHLSNLAALVAFSEDPDSPDPAEETLSKDMRFIQYISNSYVISAGVAMLVNCLVVFAIMLYPKEVLLYVLCVCLVLSFTTRWLGGVNVVEMDLLPVEIDLTYSSDFYNAGEYQAYKAHGILTSLKEMFFPSMRSDADVQHRDKENYIEALRKRRSTHRL